MPADVIPHWKRSIDLAIASITFLLLTQFALLYAIYLWWHSPGPLLFRQTRIGRYGRPFQCLKFRTMPVGISQGQHTNYLEDLIRSNRPLEKMDNFSDRRMIRGGRYIRALGLDELPQVINVLRGEMSIVGPRPCVPSEFELHEPWQRERFHARPGVTGLWQVSGKNSTTFERMIQLDIAYARSTTFLGDLGILVRTIPVVLAQLKTALNRRISPTSAVQAAARPAFTAEISSR